MFIIIIIIIFISQMTNRLRFKYKMGTYGRRCKSEMEEMELCWIYSNDS